MNENESENESKSYDDSRQKGGRPVEISIVPKHKTELRRVKARNNVSMKFTLGKRSLPCGKILPRGRLKEIIDDITSKCGVDSSDVNHNTISIREIRFNS